jgi:hypothetical protein
MIELRYPISTGESAMKPDSNERFEERLVTYALELEGRFFVIENVPAQVDVESGERFFSLAIVERIRRIIREGGTPTRTIETPVYEFTG